MFSKIVVCLTVYLCAAGVQSFNLTRDACWPLDLVSPMPYRTLAPINIDSATVKVITTPTPLKINVGLFESHNVFNTGHSVGVTAYSPAVPTSITGGVLGNGLYLFYDIIFFWGGDYSTIAASKIDGVGSPLTAVIRFRNSKYPNVAAATCHRDGFADIAININVEGYVSNPLFDSFVPILSSIVKSGSFVSKVASLPIFGWFDQFCNIKNYYAYPGAFTDFTSPGRTQFDSTTVIQLPKSLGPYISIPQFAFFQKLLTVTGTPLVNISPTYPRGSRPVVQACGVVQNFVPTAV